MKRFMGMRLTRHQISAAVINEKHQKESTGSWKLTQEDRNSEALIDRIVEAYSHQPLGSQCLAVGLVLPALIHREKGQVLYAPEFPGLEGTFLQRKVSDRLNKAVILDTLGNAKLAGESIQGAVAQHSDVIGIYLGDHIWGGILMHGHLWRGSQGMAGQIGQVVVNPTGRRCGWSGVQGALDVYASGEGLRARCVAQQTQGVDTNASDIYAELVRAADKGNEAAHEHLKQMGQSLGTALASVINFTEITKIVFSGPGKAAFAWFEETLRDEINRSCIDAIQPEVELIRGALGSDGALIGAAYNWQLQPHE